MHSLWNLELRPEVELLEGNENDHASVLELGLGFTTTPKESRTGILNTFKLVAKSPSGMMLACLSYTWHPRTSCRTP